MTTTRVPGGLKRVLAMMQDTHVRITSQGRNVVANRAFAIMLDPDDPMVWLNYAVPLCTPETSEIEGLVEAFHRNGRSPRLEFFADLWPSAIEALTKFGFQVIGTQPIMVLTQGEEMRLRPNPEISVIEGKADSVGLMHRISEAAFEESKAFSEAEEPSEARKMQKIKEIESGRWMAAIAYVDGSPAGTGVAVGDGKCREAAGIGTIPEYRNRGVASAVTAFLVNRHFEQGGEAVWLTAGDGRAQTVYANLGFLQVGTQVCMQPAEA